MCSLEFPDLETQIWQRFSDDDIVVLGMSGPGLFGSESVPARQNDVVFGKLGKGEHDDCGLKRC